MKKPGTPAIEDDSESGSAGVSADGFGARLPRLGAAVDAPVDPGFSPLPAPFDFVCVCTPPDVVPWAC